MNSHVDLKRIDVLKLLFIFITIVSFATLLKPSLHYIMDKFHIYFNCNWQLY